MEPIQFRQINKDILSVVYNKKKLGIVVVFKNKFIA